MLPKRLQVQAQLLFLRMLIRVLMKIAKLFDDKANAIMHMLVSF